MGQKIFADVINFCVTSSFMLKNPKKPRKMGFTKKSFHTEVIGLFLFCFDFMRAN